jgi:hypothetical protein
MTIKIKQFGTVFVTRYRAKKVLKALDFSQGLPALDFSGVEVANHSFADELGKGLLASFAIPDLSGIEIHGANGYITNCLDAGFATAVEA